jgi:excisionase family DNA binding protein
MAIEASADKELPPVLTVDGVAKLLRVNRKTVYAAIQRRELPGVRHIGTAIRISRDALLQWFANGQAGVSLTKKAGAS